MKWTKKILGRRSDEQAPGHGLGRGLGHDPERATLLLDQGLTLARSGKWAEAHTCFNEARELDPTRAEIHHNFSIAAAQLSDFSSAYDAAKTAANLTPDSKSFLLNLGTMALRMGEDAAAETAYQDALALSPKDPSIHGNLGILMLQREDWQQATHHLNIAASGPPPNPDLLVLLATSLRRGGQLKEAQRVIKRFLKKRPGSEEGLVEKVRILIGSEKWKEASSTADKILKLNQSNNDARYLSALSKNKAGEIEEAKSLLEEALRASPTDFNTAKLLAEIHSESHDEDSAIIVLEKYCSQSPTDYRGRLQLGAHHHQKADYVKALECYETALSLAPTDGRILMNLGRLCYEVRRYDDAQAHLEKSLASDPDNVDCIRYLSDLNLTTGRLGQGWDLYSDSSALNVRAALNWIDLDRDRPETPITGKRVLIRREQGLGDEVRWSSCYQDVIDEADSCIIQCDKRLKGLFERTFPRATIHPIKPIDSPTDVPAPTTYDVACLAGDLPTRYRRSLADFPERDAVLCPDPDLSAEWLERLNGLGNEMKIGICWRSDTINWYRMRTAFYSHLDEWGEILTTPNTSFVNLFYGECSHEIEQANAAHGKVIHQWPDLDLRNDLESVFALISQLDLVITVQTAVWNMSGAVGTDTWALLNPIMGLGTDRVPWYKSVKPVQYDIGDSSEVVLSRIAKKLRQHLSAKGHGPTS